MKKLIFVGITVLMSICSAIADPGFNKVETVKHDYTVKVYAPDGFEPSYICLGELSNLQTNMIPNIDEEGKLYYYAKFNAAEGSELNIVSSEDKNNVIRRYDKTHACWLNVNEVVLGADAVIVLNYSDSKKFMWSAIQESHEKLDAELRANQLRIVGTRPTYVMKYGCAYDESGREMR